MTRVLLSGRWGLALLASTALATSAVSAHAQRLKPMDSMTTSASSQGEVRKDFHDDPPVDSDDGVRVLVARNDLTGGVRAARQGDNSIAAYTYADYVRTPGNGGRAGFETLRMESAESCREIGSEITEAGLIITEAKRQGGVQEDIYQDLVGLADDINRATWTRRGAEVGSTLLLCLIPGVNLLYCGGAAANAIGNEGMGIAHDKASKINRRQSLANVDQSELQLRGMVLNMRATIGWGKLMLRDGHCEAYYATEVAAGAASVQPLHAQRVSYRTSIDERARNARAPERYPVEAGRDRNLEWMNYDPGVSAASAGSDTQGRKPFDWYHR